ncbi:unnamed protein product [Darwinula stevensoni]|uniref:Uncharacterized protein n=1 Tax=Darwinula stevensoni TaxID=69355 RepID=A0A7R9FSE7_9CRUS|nr:unnamed protein product [Darwinula stevensoni]CAG0903370.1 unnamed protein product [Darwinula stevensoni]
MPSCSNSSGSTDRCSSPAHASIGFLTQARTQARTRKYFLGTGPFCESTLKQETQHLQAYRKFLPSSYHPGGTKFRLCIGYGSPDSNFSIASGSTDRSLSL